MNTARTAVFVALCMLTVAVPATATDGGTSSENDAVTVLFPTPSVSSGHVYEISLSAGTSVDATLTWQAEDADLDLLLEPPGGTCDVFPNPQVGCVVASAGERVDAVTCQNEGQGQSIGLGPDTETITTTADGHDSGEATYTLWILVSTGVPLAEVPYEITLTTGDDGHEDIHSEPDPVGLIRDEGHCRGL